MIRERQERSVCSPLYSLEAQTLRVLGRVDEGVEVLERGIQSGVGAGRRKRSFELALAQIDMSWSPERAAKIRKMVQRLGRLSERLTPIDRLEAVARDAAARSLSLPPTISRRTCRS